MRGWWNRLSNRGRLLVSGGVLAVVVFGVAPAVWAGSSGSVDAAAPPTTTATEAADATSAPSATPSPTPVTVVKREQSRRALPFTTRTVDDASRAAGTRAVTQAGVAGQEVTTTEVTFVDGVETSRRVVSVVAATRPVDEVVSLGSKQPDPAPAPAAPAPPAPAGGCDPNYSGACVPIASDVDCAGGGGNGPAYVQGPVTVVGTDIYHLDRDGDGVGCES
jgi:hypothetical protein